MMTGGTSILGRLKIWLMWMEYGTEKKSGHTNQKWLHPLKDHPNAKSPPVIDPILNQAQMNGERCGKGRKKHLHIPG